MIQERIVDNKLEQLWKLFYEKNKDNLTQWHITQDLHVNGLALMFGCFLTEIIVKHEELNHKLSQECGRLNKELSKSDN